MSREPEPKWTVLMQAAALAIGNRAGAGRMEATGRFTCVRLDGPWMPEREAGAFITGQPPGGPAALMVRLGSVRDLAFRAAAQSVAGRPARDGLFGRIRRATFEAATTSRTRRMAMLDELAAGLTRGCRQSPPERRVESRGLASHLHGADLDRLRAGRRPRSLAADLKAVPPVATLGRACFPGP